MIVVFLVPAFLFKRKSEDANDSALIWLSLDLRWNGWTKKARSQSKKCNNVKQVKGTKIFFKAAKLFFIEYKVCLSASFIYSFNTTIIAGTNNK